MNDQNFQQILALQQAIATAAAAAVFNTLLNPNQQQQQQQQQQANPNALTDAASNDIQPQNLGQPDSRQSPASLSGSPSILQQQQQQAQPADAARLQELLLQLQQHAALGQASPLAGLSSLGALGGGLGANPLAASPVPRLAGAGAGAAPQTDQFSAAALAAAVAAAAAASNSGNNHHQAGANLAQHLQQLQQLQQQQQQQQQHQQQHQQQTSNAPANLSAAAAAAAAATTAAAMKKLKRSHHPANSAAQLQQQHTPPHPASSPAFPHHRSSAGSEATSKPTHAYSFSPKSHHHSSPSSIGNLGRNNGASSQGSNSNNNNHNSSSTSTSTSSSSSNAFLSNNVGLPRKLVRGQDVWLGRGAEQTRQILKCMWCGDSFKTLDDMTRHMRETKHYTNIISPEQITSWRQPDQPPEQSKHKSQHQQSQQHHQAQRHQALAAQHHQIRSSNSLDQRSIVNADDLSEKLNDSDEFDDTFSNEDDQELAAKQSSKPSSKILRSNQHLQSHSKNDSVENINSALESDYADLSVALAKNCPPSKLTPKSKKQRDTDTNSPTINKRDPSTPNKATASSSQNRRRDSTSKADSDSCSPSPPSPDVNGGDCKINGKYPSQTSSPKTTRDHKGERGDDADEEALEINSDTVRQQSDNGEEVEGEHDANSAADNEAPCKIKGDSTIVANESDEDNGSNSDNSQQENQRASKRKNPANEEDSKLRLKKKFKEMTDDGQGEVGDENDDVEDMMTDDMNENEDPEDNKLPRDNDDEEDDDAADANNIIDGDNDDGQKSETNESAATTTSGLKQVTASAQRESGDPLSALETMVEKSFDPRLRPGMANGGILQRLGIDEEVCPPWQSLNYANWYAAATYGHPMAAALIAAGMNLQNGIKLSKNIGPKKDED